MDSLAVRNQPTIESPLFELFVNQYQSNLLKKGYDMFQVPSVLKDICQVVFLHNQKKSVKYASIPKDTFFVVYVDKFLEYLNSKIRKETRGYFNRVDETTEMRIRNPEFRSAIIAFFYLEGIWTANSYGTKPFFNSNGTIAKNIIYFGFSEIQVFVADGKLKANIKYYCRHKETIRGMVSVTMPVGSDYDEGIYENSLLILPEVDLQYKHEEMNGDETKVIQFRYKHDYYGFSTLDDLLYPVSSDGGLWRRRKTFILNKPFEIDIYFKAERVLHVIVDNLESKEHSEEEIERRWRRDNCI